jgi:phosphate transport system substrate-binding protein
VIFKILLFFLGLGVSPFLMAKRELISIDGSSTVYPLTEAVAEEFQTQKRGQIRVTVGVSGTGGGFKKFCRGQTMIQNASRPISPEEKLWCEKQGVTYLELPVAYDALVVIVHRENHWVSELSVEDLKTMWEPQKENPKTLWSQIQPHWPKRPLRLYAPGPDSGTFDYFTEAIMGQAKMSRSDFTASEDDNTIVQGVYRDKEALGYLGFAYYMANQDKLKAVRIIPPWEEKEKGAKAPPSPGVFPQAHTILSGEYKPLSRSIFIYVNSNTLKHNPLLQEFVLFFLNQASVLSHEVGYVPLPETTYTKGTFAVRELLRNHRLKAQNFLKTLEPLFVIPGFPEIQTFYEEFSPYEESSPRVWL